MSSAIFEDIQNFLGATRWEGSEIAPLVGDASFRRYFRIRRGGQSAMLMHAPPPHEDPRPFLHVAEWLNANGLRGPEILREEAEKGWVLTEDFGDTRMKEWIDELKKFDAIYFGAVGSQDVPDHVSPSIAPRQ